MIKYEKWNRAMNQKSAADWNPRSEDVLKDPIPAYDHMRRHCPMARGDDGYTSLFRHCDVQRALDDHETFSSAVSRFPAVPNGMDPPEHTEFRRVIDPYFSARRMNELEPQCRAIAVDLAAALPAQGEAELMAEFAHVFALRAQCAFLGWPDSLHEPLRQWTHRNHLATLARDESAQGAVALEFDGYIKEILAQRRDSGAQAPDDATTRLMREQVFGRPLDEREIISILRNWTVGELATISASIGIVAHYLAARPELQGRLRRQPALLPPAIDEILRINAPLIMNRRVATKPAALSAGTVAAGERIALVWASANRDEAVFGDPDEFRLDRDPRLNLLYGAGVHVCPGAPLARMELRIITEELLAGTRRIALVAGKDPVKAFYPASGFSSLPLFIRKADAPT